MSSLGRALLGLGLAGLLYRAGGRCALILTQRPRRPTRLFAALALVVGWSFIGTGLFAWWRRPENRFGRADGRDRLRVVPPGADRLRTRPGSSCVGAALRQRLRSSCSSTCSSRSRRAARRPARERRSWPRRGSSGLALQIRRCSFLETPDERRLRRTAPTTRCWSATTRRRSQVLFAVQALLGDRGAGRRWSVVLVAALARGDAGPQRTALGPCCGRAGSAMVAVRRCSSPSGPRPARRTRCAERSTSPRCWPCSRRCPFAFLVGLLRTRFSRAGAVSELVDAPRRDAGRRGRGLRDALADGARAIPTLELAYWLPEREPLRRRRRAAGRAAASAVRAGWRRGRARGRADRARSSTTPRSPRSPS